MKLLGLTGSIGMGKTTTAGLFREAGLGVYDADAEVHALYGRGGGGVPLIDAGFPGCVVDGQVDRTRLGRAVLGDPQAMARLEAIVHPLLRAGRSAAVDRARASGAAVYVLDVPLLYETHGETAVDAVAVVTCSPELQRARVLARPGMTEETFQALLSRQLPDFEKRKRADFVIDTGAGLEPVRRRIGEIVRALAPDERAL